MTVVPMDIKEGMGVGTTFRIIGDFSGKRLEWDCETTEFIRNEKITAKQIEGPFKNWQITNEFKALGIQKCHIFVISNNSEGITFWKKVG